MNRKRVANERKNRQEPVRREDGKSDFLHLGGDLSVWMQDVRACLTAVQAGMEKVLESWEEGERPAPEPPSLQLAVTDLREVVESVRHPLAGTAALAGVEWRVELPAGPCLVRTDAPAFSRMLGYMLMEALCFAPSCVTLRLRVAAGRGVELSVADNGHDRFTGCTGCCGGYGPLVRRLAVVLKGALSMESAVGKGTTVTVVFPPAAPDGPAGEAPADAAREVDATGVPWSLASQAFLDRVDGILEPHLSDTHFRVDLLAQELGMSRTAMFVKLKEALGMTPNGYVRSYRLQKAAALLSESDLQVSEVCFQVGFSSPSYFTRCFQQQYGMKPAEYKKKGKTVI